MSGVQSRLSKLASQFLPSATATSAEYQHRPNIHTLSPTIFLPRAAAVEPDVQYSFSIADLVKPTEEVYRQKPSTMLLLTARSYGAHTKRQRTGQEG